MGQGMLYLCATPIGNLQDISARCIEVLREADLIAAEDTRNSLTLLNRYDIHTPLTAYHEYNRYDKADELVRLMREGKTVACITDAGTPGISDPGEVLVRKCREAGILVTGVPGPCAAVNALAISGLSTRRFRFEGFPPVEKKDRTALYEALSKETATTVLYEAPHRLRKTLSEMAELLGDREIALCREMTKIHEEVLRTTVNGAVEHYENEVPRGEYVLVLSGRSKESIEREARKAWEEMSVSEHVAYYEAKGFPRKEAMRLAAADRGVSRRDVYEALLEK